MRYMHPKNTSTSKCQQLLIYRRIFSWTIALFAVDHKNFLNFAHGSEWVLFLRSSLVSRSSKRIQRKRKQNLVSLNIVGLNISSVAT